MSVLADEGDAMPASVGMNGVHIEGVEAGQTTFQHLVGMGTGHKLQTAAVCFSPSITGQAQNPSQGWTRAVIVMGIEIGAFSEDGQWKGRGLGPADRKACQLTQLFGKSLLNPVSGVPQCVGNLLEGVSTAPHETADVFVVL